MRETLSQSQKLVYDQCLSHSLPPEGVEARFDINIHGLPVTFFAPNSDRLRSLDSYFPKTWSRSPSSQAINIYWQSPQDVAGPLPAPWGDVVSPDCQFLEDFVFQRDFCARWFGPRDIHLVTDYGIGDGIFNFLRYFLPHRLLAQEKVIFHSSCLLNSQDEAFLFFGFSGAGKTTLTKICHQATALGDDMNLISIADDQVMVEPALVGQQIYSPSLFGRSYPVKAAFWLEKSDELEISPLKMNRKGRLLSSFSGLFWQELSRENYQKVFSFLHRLEMNLPLYQLKFSLQSEVWDAVRTIK